MLMQSLEDQFVELHVGESATKVIIFSFPNNVASSQVHWESDIFPSSVSRTTNCPPLVAKVVHMKSMEYLVHPWDTLARKELTCVQVIGSRYW